MATIRLEFIPPSPVPADGYVVRYREVGTVPYTTLNYLSSQASPILITGQPDGKNWEGFIASVCSGSSQSSEVPWSVNDSLTCKTYLLETIEDLAGPTAGVTYINCAGDADGVDLGPNESFYICARAGTIVNSNPTELTITETAIGCVTDTLDPEAYDVTAPAITGTCNFASTTGSRTVDAANNSSANNVRILMTVRFTSDGLSGSPFVDHQYTFEIGATVANESHAVDLSSGGVCSQIFISIVNIEIIP